MAADAWQVGGWRVEVRHVTTADRFREALRAHARVSPAVRRQRWVAIAAAVVVRVKIERP